MQFPLVSPKQNSFGTSSHTPPRSIFMWLWRAFKVIPVILWLKCGTWQEETNPSYMCVHSKEKLFSCTITQSFIFGMMMIQSKKETKDQHEINWYAKFNTINELYSLCSKTIYCRSSVQDKHGINLVVIFLTNKCKKFPDTKCQLLLTTYIQILILIFMSWQQDLCMDHYPGMKKLFPLSDYTNCGKCQQTEWQR